MIRNNLARNEPNQGPKHRYHYSSSAPYQRLNPNFHARTRRLALSAYEKKLIVIGSLVIVALMMMLISSKLSDGDYQQHCQSLSVRISRLQGKNSNLQQRVSNLQSNHRLSRIARKSNLKPSNGNVKNVR